MAVIIIAGVTLAIYKFLPSNRTLSWIAILVIIIIFIALKYEPLAVSASVNLRVFQQQDPSHARATDIAWLGFSYLAFRLVHTLRDFQSDRLPAFHLSDYLTYVLFYPSLTAGPIDRSQRFIEKDLHTPTRSSDRIQGLERILIGIFKKFVLADSLALISLNQAHLGQVNSTLWLWILLYAFSLRIYFDFSGYTDIAIGTGMFVGIHLPENFSNPYLKTNITAFWNSWHITLAQWFRSYVFNPLTRNLRLSRCQFPAWFIILVGQTITMLLIGLWHGITWSFAIWGLWHAMGLFIHNRWSEWSRPRLAALSTPQSGAHIALNFGGWLLTFNYVVLGWVWFALPQPAQAIEAFRLLLGG
jgi:D-alanyl-lipoteichoic acid acyltransferase DltB (MBOAT superfamily)